MSAPPRNEWLWFVAAAGVAFAVVAVVMRADAPAQGASAPPPAEAAPASLAPLPTTTGGRRAPGWAHAQRRSAADGQRIRVDDLRDWFRFRYEQPVAAMHVEYSVLTALDRQGLAGILARCGVEEGSAHLELVAQVRARGTTGAVEGWDCEPGPTASADAVEACGCITEWLPGAFDVALIPPPGMPPTTVSYEGELSVGI